MDNLRNNLSGSDAKYVIQLSSYPGHFILFLCGLDKYMKKVTCAKILHTTAVARVGILPLQLILVVCGSPTDGD